MNGFKYKSILYLISAVILATLCIQVYWNYKNYLTGKQQLANDVQTSLDNAVDQYYTELATKGSFKIFADTLLFPENPIKKRAVFLTDTCLTPSLTIDTSYRKIKILHSEFSDNLDINLTILDSVRTERLDNSVIKIINNSKNPITELSSKIVVSFSEDRLSLAKIDSLFYLELERKNIGVDYGLSHSGVYQETEELRPEIIEQATLETVSNSPYFFRGNNLTAHFTNVTLAVLKKNLVGILLSFLLVGSVIICLLYLLKIIKQQKQLAEVKNDLISNITHEFKTPLATIGIAMEAIQNFNAENDSEKNIRYAKISKEQVDKLNMMVEKLLETATLDSEKLELNFETHNLVELLQIASQNEAFIVGDKTISFSSTEEDILYSIDVFHFENAINNIIDNAIKYGGKDISVEIVKQNNSIEITISDSGTSLTEAHKKQIFEKFFRVPKGNTHDVKGFGIGLYYTKKIIEKHNGNIDLSIKPNTTFKITLPDG
jgi:two-component system phosphate regulon sensor histidine kinase PhoR